MRLNLGAVCFNFACVAYQKCVGIKYNTLQFLLTNVPIMKFVYFITDMQIIKNNKR